LETPFELKNRYNSKVGRALWLVNKNRVKLDLELKVYLIKDEKDNCFQVKLLPKPTCTCVEKTSCCHIMAVESINGVNIENNYKIPNISKITKTKNSGSTGRKKSRKKRGHVVNSIDSQLIQASKSNMSMYEYEHYLKELMDEKFHNLLDQALSSKLVIQANMVCTDFSKLSDIFIKDFDLKILKPMFDENAWKEVLSVYNLKIKKSTCIVCDNLCSENSIECDVCHYWYHFSCAKVSRYHQSGKSKTWVCGKYGFECNSDN